MRSESGPRTPAIVVSASSSPVILTHTPPSTVTSSHPSPSPAPSLEGPCGEKPFIIS